MLTLRPNAKCSTSAAMTEMEASLNTPFCAPMVPFSTNNTSSATGGSTLTAQRPRLLLSPGTLSSSPREMPLTRGWPRPEISKAQPQPKPITEHLLRAITEHPLLRPRLLRTFTERPRRSLRTSSPHTDLLRCNLGIISTVAQLIFEAFLFIST